MVPLREPVKVRDTRRRSTAVSVVHVANRAEKRLRVSRTFAGSRSETIATLLENGGIFEK